MKAPPRLVARMLAVTFLTVAVILSVVFIVLIVATRNRVRDAETARLQAGGRVFSSLEANLQRGQLATVATLAENPTLKAALDTYVTEREFGGLAPEQERALRLTVTQELQALASVTGADVLAIVDNDGTTYASTGPLSERWPVGERIDLSTLPQPAFQSVLVLPAGAFRVTGASLRLGDRDVGSLLLAARLDRGYAEQLSTVAGAGIVISVNRGLVASTVSTSVTNALLADEESPNATRTLDGEEYAVATLLWSGPARIYTLSSIDEAAREQTGTALRALATVALGGFVLAGFCSLWLARTLSRPIDRVSSSIAAMAATRDFDRTLEPTGSSRELDALTASFNGLMRDVVTARAETQAAYLGAIRALAAALDARDPYTAGHSERVSTLSVRIARHLQLEEAAVDVVGLGALLHDIGKIGISDEVLRKPGPLTPAEFEEIKQHPLVGARILRQVGFLTAHLPIVELHHERPDGRGYPFGLHEADIPLAARIVHVADAYDAMTSARAYRPARAGSAALTELRRGAGSDFDSAVVDAACAVALLPEAAAAPRAGEAVRRPA